MARTIDTYATKAQSWNDLLHEYELARSTKPPPAEKPPKRQKDIVKKQHEFDIMTGVYKDPRKEIFARELEAQRVSRDVVRDAHAPIHRDFDIVANTEKQCAGAEVGIGDTQSRGKLIRGLSQPPRPYDIITIRESANKDANKPENLERFALEGLTPVKKVTLNTPPSFIRDYSIASNKYLVGHDEKQKMDDNLTLKAASHSLFRKQKYDPIVGQFISEKLDKKDWDKRSRYCVDDIGVGECNHATSRSLIRMFSSLA
ncbi:MAG: hypothetical protein EZS28_015395 [Streblomastix strix]|uniref:Uncharacterized protein n=1 Tax=Streblomastix strix TaxID=222440 RepID=A0A5J4W2E5_9EUKA|nr:MAG: hypothetical protein EZS28_015395 [Streblomastix strix]